MAHLVMLSPSFILSNAASFMTTSFSALYSGGNITHRRGADNPFTPQVCQAKQRRQRYREKKPSRHVPTSCARIGAYNAAPMGHERQSTTRPSLTNLCKPPTDPR